MLEHKQHHNYQLLKTLIHCKHEPKKYTLIKINQINFKNEKTSFEMSNTEQNFVKKLIFLSLLKSVEYNQQTNANYLLHNNSL